mmetsp:Transcript_41218/g.78731  ORF Transcript_41218/g.78731 Transcript_41218/m.78731 type:complete len:270 (-) Transcript_41218:327-1136(-)
MNSLTAMDTAAIGGIAGAVEVTLQQPTVTMKNFLQQGKPIPLNPKVLYRGWFVNCASIAPICCIQFGVNRALENFLERSGVESSHATLIGTAAAAGVVSSVVSCPAELVMLHQQKKGGSFASVSRGVVSEHSARILYRGMLPTVAREALWVGSYLGLVPVLQDELGKIEPLADSPYTVWALAASSAGLIGGTLTHPLDSIKTRMQMNLRAEAVTSASMLAAVREVTREGALFAGYLPRTARILGASFILNTVKAHLGDALEASRRTTAL